MVTTFAPANLQWFGAESAALTAATTAASARSSSLS